MPQAHPRADLAATGACGDNFAMSRAPRPRLRAGLGVLVAGVLALPGCRLVDQRTFEGTALAPQPSQLSVADYASRAQPLPPLAIVRFGSNDQSWRAPLVQASRAARQRKADVQFDLVAPIPIAAPITEQDQASRDGAADAATVARVLEADGVSADALHLGQRGDAGNPPRQIEVYVR